MEADVLERFVEYRANGSRRLRNALVEEHLDLVEYYVNRYGKGQIEADDVRQQAFMALIKAVERFDPEVGVTFKTFANRTIEGELKRLLRDKGWSVRPPRSLQELAVQARRLEPQLTQQLGRTPRVADLAEWLEESTDRVLEALAAGASFRADSLDAPVGDGSLTKGAMLAGSDGDHGRHRAARWTCPTCSTASTSATARSCTCGSSTDAVTAGDRRPTRRLAVVPVPPAAPDPGDAARGPRGRAGGRESDDD